MEWGVWLVCAIAAIGVILIGFVVWLIVKTKQSEKEGPLDDVFEEAAKEAGQKSRPGIMSEK